MSKFLGGQASDTGRKMQTNVADRFSSVARRAIQRLAPVFVRTGEPL